MTQEDKKLLLKDICARLPYEVYAETVNELGETHINRICSENINLVTSGWFKEFKPYLRPMSSITEEERKEYNDIVKNTIGFYDCPKSEEICFFIIPIEWLNARHFDYRGLIEKGLALVAPEGMYK